MSRFSGDQLESIRPYLLALANDRLPRALRAKIAPSDIVQEALIESTTATSPFVGGSSAQLKAWLRRIVINRIIDVQRSLLGTQKRNVCLETRIEDLSGHVLPKSGTSPSGRMSRDESIRDLVDALVRLPPSSREIVVLYQFDGLSFAQIAKRTNQAESTVRNQWVKSIEALRAELS